MTSIRLGLLSTRLSFLPLVGCEVLVASPARIFLSSSACPGSFGRSRPCGGHPPKSSTSNYSCSNKPVLLPPVESGQYASAQIAAFATQNGLTRSMGYTGVCWDNAMAESFFATLKTEFYYRRVWPTRKRAKIEVGAWIEDRYNRRRRHASVGQPSPVRTAILKPDRAPPRSRITRCPRNGVKARRPHPSGLMSRGSAQRPPDPDRISSMRLERQNGDPIHILGTTEH